MKCPRCKGCGKIANDKEGAPWSVWTSTPECAKAVRMGWVLPIPCPDCGGTGKCQTEK